MKNLFAILTALLGGACSTPRNIPDAAVLLDVRTEAEFNRCHIPGSILIPHDRIPAEVAAKIPDKNTPVLIFCRSGRRSAIAKKSMEQLGYKNLQDLGSIENAAGTLNKKLVSGQ